MRRKILEIKEDIERIVSISSKEKLWINWYGEYTIDPKNLVFWICVESDNAKRQLKENAELNTELRGLLIKHNYPEQARQFVQIDFESQETVDRDYNSSWYDCFK